MELAIPNYQNVKRLPKPILFFGLLLLLCVLGCGFVPIPDSVHGIATDDTVCFDPVIVGTWEWEHKDNSPDNYLRVKLRIESQDKRTYQISFSNKIKEGKGEPERMCDGVTKAKLVKLGDFYFLDCFESTIRDKPDGPNLLETEHYKRFKASNGRPAHRFYLLTFKDDKLCLNLIEAAKYIDAKSEICKKEIIENKNGQDIVTNTVDEPICTAETPELQAALRKYITSGSYLISRAKDEKLVEMRYSSSVQAKAKVVQGESVASASQRTLTVWMELRYRLQGLVRDLTAPNIAAAAAGVSRNQAEEKRLTTQARRQAIAEFVKAIGDLPMIGVDASLTELVDQLSAFAKRMDGQLDEDALNAQGLGLLFRRAAGQDVAQEGQAMVREAKAVRDEWSRLPDTLEAVRKKLSQKHEISFPKVNWEAAK